MIMLGAHVSAAGGAHQIFARGRAIGAECLQLFTRPPSQWKAAPLTPEAIDRFRQAHHEHGAPPVLAHDIYLNNLAAANDEVRERSLATMVEEVQRGHLLGLDGLVCHLGSHPNRALGIARYAEAIREILAQTDERAPLPILLESCAGQGTTLGSSLDELAEVIERNQGHPRLGVCLDTCHLFAAGYDLRSEESYQEFWRTFDQTVGLERLQALHLNDSKKPLGSRVDRHDHIGQGEIGLPAFGRLVRDPRLGSLPAVIETPEMESMHAVNLERLKALRLTAPAPEASL